MSTLTSADMHVKRSSTRLHAPPGGRSSLGFGAGGFGSMDPPRSEVHDSPVSEQHFKMYDCPSTTENSRLQSAVQPPQTSGSYRGETAVSRPPPTSYYGDQAPPTSGSYRVDTAMSRPPPTSNYYADQAPPTSGSYRGEAGLARPPPTSSYYRDQAMPTTNAYGSGEHMIRSPPSSGAYEESISAASGMRGYQDPLIPPTAGSYRSDLHPSTASANNRLDAHRVEGDSYYPTGGADMNHQPSYSSFGREASLSRGNSTVSSTWTQQPPLTSSKRDQNWEKKRRLWLARRGSSVGSRSTSSCQSYGPPPTSSYQSLSSARHGATSPLSKLVQQQQFKQRVSSHEPATFGSGNQISHQYGNRSPWVDHGRRIATPSDSGRSTMSSSSRRPPPGGHSQWNPYA